MKKLILIGTCLCCASGLFAQSDEKPVTIRIKKIENVNGIEKVSDTTFTTTNPAAYQIQEGKMESLHWDEKDEAGKKIIRIQEGSGDSEIIIDNDFNGSAETITISSLDAKDGSPSIKKIVLNDPKGTMSAEEIQKHLDVQMKELDKEMKSKDGQLHQAIFIKTECESKTDNQDQKSTQMIIIKRVRISEPSAEDSKMLNKQTGISDEKLQVENMKFFPNPNDGKFNLEFQVTSKGDTELNILNMEGKSIYNENLKNFSGQYSNAINISDQPKGVYFVKIKQGKHAQVKKIVLE